MRVKVGKTYTVSWSGGVDHGVVVEKIEAGAVFGKNAQGNEVYYVIDQHDWIERR